MSYHNDQIIESLAAHVAELEAGNARLRDELARMAIPPSAAEPPKPAAIVIIHTLNKGEEWHAFQHAEDAKAWRASTDNWARIATVESWTWHPAAQPKQEGET